jgi:acetylornithine aminotransferase
VQQIRGRGLMIAIELDRPCGELVPMALERGLIINVTADNVVRLVPPLTFNFEHADLLLSNLTPLLREFVSGAPAHSAA